MTKFTECLNILDMKRFYFFIIFAILFTALPVSACATLSSSLVFYEIQENDSYGEWAGEMCITENTDKSIKKLKVPQTYNGKSVSVIGGGVFAGCSMLTEVYLPEGLKVIEDSSFALCEQLLEINLPESMLFIGSRAFEGDSELKKITIGKNVFRIAENAFNNCNNIQEVYYSGSQEEWSKIDIWEGNDFLINANIHFAI